MWEGLGIGGMPCFHLRPYFGSVYRGRKNIYGGGTAWRTRPGGVYYSIEKCPWLLNYNILNQ